MANTNINIRMDADLKRQFEAFCADMGMTMTTAFNVFARKAVSYTHLDVYKRQERISRTRRRSKNGAGLASCFEVKRT